MTSEQEALLERAVLALESIERMLRDSLDFPRVVRIVEPRR